MSVQDFATTVSEEKKAAKKEERKLTAYDVSLQEDALESQHRLVDGIATQCPMICRQYNLFGTGSKPTPFRCRISPHLQGNMP